MLWLFLGASASFFFLRVVPQPPLKYYHDGIYALCWGWGWGGQSQVCGGLSAPRGARRFDRGHTGKNSESRGSRRLHDFRSAEGKREIKVGLFESRARLKCLHDMR